MADLTPKRSDRIFKIVNLFTAKELSDLLFNYGINERHTHHERLIARDKVLEIVNGDVETLIGNLNADHMLKVIQLIQLPVLGNRHSHQKEILAYLASNPIESNNTEELIGNYIDKKLISWLLNDLSKNYIFDKFLILKEKEILYDAVEVLKNLYNSNPKDEIEITLYTYKFTDYNALVLKIHPNYISVKMETQENLTIAAYRGGVRPKIVPLSWYYVNKNGQIEGDTSGIINIFDKIKVSKKTNL